MPINIEYLPILLVTAFGSMTNTGMTSMKTVDDRFCIPLLNKDLTKKEFEFFLICWEGAFPS